MPTAIGRPMARRDDRKMCSKLTRASKIAKLGHSCGFRAFRTHCFPISKAPEPGPESDGSVSFAPFCGLFLPELHVWAAFPGNERLRASAEARRKPGEAPARHPRGALPVGLPPGQQAPRRQR
eukprot:scaffold3928_cov257-Pinguiococcus_pyrenoidosus.AAC.8